MTKKQFELREQAIKAKYIDNNVNECVEAQMELFKRIKLKTFFRYRSLNEYELKSLEDDTIFLRWPSTYEDIGDCTPVFDYEEITEYIRRKKYGFIDEKQYHNKLLDYEYIKNNDKIREKLDDLRDMNLVACFTERYNNERMWTNYANHGEGICLAYNSVDLLKYIRGYSSTLDAQFLPVRYVECREKCRDMMLNHYDLLEDRPETNNKYLISCMTKDKSNFSYEEEWRFLLLAERKEEHVGKGKSAPFIGPNTIIFGSNIDKKSDLYIRLVEIARSKNIRTFDCNQLI